MADTSAAAGPIDAAADSSPAEAQRLCPMCGHRWMPEHRHRDEGCQALAPGYEGCGCVGPDEWRD